MKLFHYIGIIVNSTLFHLCYFYLINSLYLDYMSCQVVKNVFVIFYSGERAKSKILKICEAFGANRYPFTEDIGKQMQMMSEVCVRNSVAFVYLYWYTVHFNLNCFNSSIITPLFYLE